MSERDVGVIIVAAGAATRTGSAELKQFRWLAGKPMLLHSIHLFQSREDVALVVCVLPREHAADPPPWIFQSDLERLLLSVGGRERWQSVAAGLDDMPPEVQVILVHDAARPLADAATVERVIMEARRGHGAVAAIPVTDTLKEVDEEGMITHTVDRVRLWRAQTPQGFPREMLDRAHTDAAARGEGATDDAAMCERLGFPVVVVQGSEMAMKVTEEADFARLEALAAARP